MESRHELKFFITDVQQEILKARIKHLCRRDENQKQADGYTITSMYFDTPYDRFLSESIDGVDRRHKYRLRYYDRNADFVKLERKSKFHGMTVKKAAVITQDEMQVLLNGQIPHCSDTHSEIKNELFCQMHMCGLQPKVIVQYCRDAYIHPSGNVRITFDRNICGSTELDAFGKSTISTVPLMNAGVHILEVKYDEFLPCFIREALQTEFLQKTSYSKYKQARIVLG